MSRDNCDRVSPLLRPQRLAFWGCLVVGAVASLGCRQSGRVTITVEKAQVSRAGAITLSLRSVSRGSFGMARWLRSNSGDSKLGGSRVTSDWLSEGKGESSVTFDTDDSSSVHFFVGEGESFTLSPGMEKVLMQFSRQEGDGHEVASYVIKVD
jgi:hypothetical protein